MKHRRSRTNPPSPGKPRRPGPRPVRPRHQSKGEEVFHGVRACAALFARRPQDIVRVYLVASRRRRFADLLAWCGRERKGFQIVEDDNLERITGSLHHEGVAVLARGIRRWNLTDLLAAEIDGPVIYLDGVRNPHNLGSILRTAAHFGVRAVAGRAGELPPLSAAAVRVAEGAADHVPVCDLADPIADLGRLKRAGFRIVVTSSRSGGPTGQVSLAGRTIIVLGSEGEGVSPPIERLADDVLTIPGTGAVESLNVSVACGVVLAEAWRQVSRP